MLNSDRQTQPGRQEIVQEIGKLLVCVILLHLSVVNKQFTETLYVNTVPPAVHMHTHSTGQYAGGEREGDGGPG